MNRENIECRWRRKGVRSRLRGWDYGELLEDAKSHDWANGGGKVWLVKDVVGYKFVLSSRDNVLQVRVKRNGWRNDR